MTAGAFAIDANTGVITVADGANLTPGTATIKVRVTDQGGLSFDKTFNITVDDPAKQICRCQRAQNGQRG